MPRLFTAIGLQGAYMAKLFEHSKGRPLYIARRSRGPRLARHASPDADLASEQPAFFVAASGRPVVADGGGRRAVAGQSGTTE